MINPLVTTLVLAALAVIMVGLTWYLEGRPSWRRKVEGWSDYCFRDSHTPVNTDMRELLAPLTPREQLYISQRDEWEKLARAYHAALLDKSTHDWLTVLTEHPLPIAPGEKP